MMAATLAAPTPLRMIPTPTPARKPPRRPPSSGCKYVHPAAPDTPGGPCGGRSWCWSPRDGLYFCGRCSMPELHRPAPAPSTPPPLCPLCAALGCWSGDTAWWYCPTCGHYIGAPPLD